jgi:hypothetical protein
MIGADAEADGRLPFRNRFGGSGANGTLKSDQIPSLLASKPSNL